MGIEIGEVLEEQRFVGVLSGNRGAISLDEVAAVVYERKDAEVVFYAFTKRGVYLGIHSAKVHDEVAASICADAVSYAGVPEKMIVLDGLVEEYMEVFGGAEDG